MMMLGAVIVGSVDGNRIWGKELKLKLAHVQWSPSGRLLLFGNDQGELHLYDHSGVFVVRFSKLISRQKLKITAMKTSILLNWLEWIGKLFCVITTRYSGIKGYRLVDAPCLAIGFENGKIQLMRNEKDKSIKYSLNIRPICS